MNLNDELKNYIDQDVWEVHLNGEQVRTRLATYMLRALLSAGLPELMDKGLFCVICVVRHAGK